MIEPVLVCVDDLIHRLADDPRFSACFACRDVHFVEDAELHAALLCAYKDGC
jgi:hypothetical protein